MQDRSEQAVEVCLEYLRQEEGVEWSAHPTDQEVRQEYDRLWRLIGSRSIEALVDLPLMNELSALATMDVLTRLWSAAFFTDENLAVLVATHMAIRSIEHGNTHASCCGYAWLAIMAGSFFGDYRSTRRFGQLSVDLFEKRALPVLAARVSNVFAAGVVPWTQHISAGAGFLRRALDFGAKSGDRAFSAYSYMHLSSHLLACGEPLDKIEAAVSTGLSFVRKARFGLIVAQHTTHLQLTRTLRGLKREFGAFSDASFDEGEFEQRLVKNPSLSYAACWYWIRKMQARVWANDPAAAVPAADKARALLWTSRAVVEHAEYHFYGRWHEPHPAIRQRPTSASSISRRWSLTIDSSRYGRRTALRISKIALRWLVRRSHASKAGTLMPCASTSRPSAQPTQTALFTMRPSQTNSRRASTWHAALRRSRMLICRMPGTAIFVGEPLLRCDNSTNCIRSLKSKSQCPVRRARSRQRSNNWTSLP